MIALLAIQLGFLVMHSVILVGCPTEETYYGNNSTNACQALLMGMTLTVLVLVVVFTFSTLFTFMYLTSVSYKSRLYYFWTSVKVLLVCLLILLFSSVGRLNGTGATSMLLHLFKIDAPTTNPDEYDSLNNAFRIMVWVLLGLLGSICIGITLYCNARILKLVMATSTQLVEIHRDEKKLFLRFKRKLVALLAAAGVIGVLVITDVMLNAFQFLSLLMCTFILLCSHFIEIIRGL